MGRAARRSCLGGLLELRRCSGRSCDDADGDWPTQSIGPEWLATTDTDVPELDRANIETACPKSHERLCGRTGDFGSEPRSERSADRLPLPLLPPRPPPTLPPPPSPPDTP